MSENRFAGCQLSSSEIFIISITQCSLCLRYENCDSFNKCFETLHHDVPRTGFSCWNHSKSELRILHYNFKFKSAGNGNFIPCYYDFTFNTTYCDSRESDTNVFVSPHLGSCRQTYTVCILYIVYTYTQCLHCSNISLSCTDYR